MSGPQPEPVAPDSGITADDIERARIAWERAQLPKDKLLLDAEVNVRARDHGV